MLFRSTRDGNTIHGSGYPQISRSVGMDMECIFCPWISWGGYPRIQGLDLDIDFTPWISIGYPFDGWDPHVSDSYYINNPNHTSLKSKDIDII